MRVANKNRRILSFFSFSPNEKRCRGMCQRRLDSLTAVQRHPDLQGQGDTYFLRVRRASMGRRRETGDGTEPRLLMDVQILGRACSVPLLNRPDFTRLLVRDSTIQFRHITGSRKSILSDPDLRGTPWVSKKGPCSSYPRGQRQGGSPSREVKHAQVRISPGAAGRQPGPRTTGTCSKREPSTLAFRLPRR